jgi:hypothetical protein
MKLITLVLFSCFYMPTAFADECSPTDYLEIRPDVKQSGLSAQIHYEKHGKLEGMCRPSASTPSRFSGSTNGKCTPQEYFTRRPGVADSGMTASSHYLKHGFKEGMCSPTNTVSTSSVSSSGGVASSGGGTGSSGGGTGSSGGGTGSSGGGTDDTSSGPRITELPPIIAGATYLDEAIGKTIRWNRGWDKSMGHRSKLDPNVKLTNFRVTIKPSYRTQVNYNKVQIKHWGEQNYFKIDRHVIYAKAVVLIDRGDYVEGGPFEWSLDNQDWIGLANIILPKPSDAQGWVKEWLPPPSGQVAWFFLMSDDERFASNPIPFNWP